MRQIILIWVIIIPLGLSAQLNPEEIQLANEYFINGEFEKAADKYALLANHVENIPEIHTNYFNVLLSLNDFKTATKYLKVVRKNFPGNVYYKIDEGILAQIMNKPEEATKIFNAVVEEVKTNKFLVRTAAQYFISKQLNEYALQCYLHGKRYESDADNYALELANVYRMMSRKDEMIREYLNFAALRPNNLTYVKNILQNLLQEQADIDNFKQILIDLIQKNPNEALHSDLLIWVNIQQKDFYGAFIQAKAVDKRFNESGSRIMELGTITLENKAFDDAITIYTYIVKTYPDGSYYSEARRQIIKAREEKIKKQYPIDISAIKLLTKDYQSLIDDIGINNQTLEAYRSKALLHAFYLNEKDTAIKILNTIITTPRADIDIQSKSKLDLGDIYLLMDEPWESTLLYSQVEKSNKSNPIGYDAKLKNAKLNYFRGNFELAKSHLDILKLATTKEIANDAISLSLLIQDNTVLDSSDFVMKEYAAVELMLFQNKRDSAQIKFKEMLKKYPGHTLTDEILWQLANISLETGNFDIAINYLDEVLAQYSYDIFGDDALFLKAVINEENLHDTATAMDIYKKFLTTYPGSIYVSEARKKFRTLRGDNIY